MSVSSTGTPEFRSSPVSTTLMPRHVEFFPVQEADINALVLAASDFNVFLGLSSLALGACISVAITLATVTFSSDQVGARIGLWAALWASLAVSLAFGCFAIANYSRTDTAKKKLLSSPQA